MASGGAIVPALDIEIFGKWILAGEHAVLRGCPALVFPIFSKSLRLRYFDSQDPLSTSFSGEFGEDLRVLFLGVMERGLEKLTKSLGQVTGRFELENSIPLGAGMGASATLCVAVGRWFLSKGWIKEEDLYEFSRQLENLFHGESSGVDIAVALSGRGLHFERNGIRREVTPIWRPQWYLSYSGKRGVTSDCVARVKRLAEKNPGLARELDAMMARAVEISEVALMRDELNGFDLLVEAMNLGRQCFDSWGLTQGEAGEHLKWLLAQGAVAVKPTGSGDGGFALSLWRNDPPMDLRKTLISVY